MIGSARDGPGAGARLGPGRTVITAQPATAFGALLRQHRLAAGLTQASLAERAGISERAVQHLERGLGQPQRDTLRRLAAALALGGEERAGFEAAAQPAPRRRSQPVGPASGAGPDAAFGQPPLRPAQPGPGDTDDGRAGGRRLSSTSPVIVGHGLPADVSSFVGRQAELAELKRRLATTRLLTLIGPGGVGKTRLALALAAAASQQADDYPDGVIFVDLAPLHDARLVPTTVAHTLGVRESGGHSARALLLAWLRERRLLLILDNFEHLLGATPLVSELLLACPQVTMLVTSRIALRVRAEQRFAVRPLATPTAEAAEHVDDLLAWPAVRLFVERARAVAADFAFSPSTAPAVVSICRRLDGLPLAIELAAARVPLLPPAALLRRLDRRLAVLTGGAPDLPERQQTLRNTLVWSHDLLEPADQVLFRRLAVFAGSWSLEMVEAVCADAALPPEQVLDRLQVLVDSSLIQIQSQSQSQVRRLEDPEGERPADGGAGPTSAEPRLSMLGTTREFALELLESSGEAERVRDRHAAALLQLAEQRVSALKSSGQSDPIVALGRERDNLRAALDWLASRSDRQPALRLAAMAAWLWSADGRVAEGREQLERLLAAAPEPTPARAVALLGASMLAWGQGDYQIQERLARESLAIARAHGQTEATAEALSTLGAAAFQRGEYGAARGLLFESLELFRGLGQRLGIGWSLMRLASVARDEGQLAEATRLYQEALAMRRSVGDRTGVGHILSNLSWLALYAGEYTRARALQEESLAIRRAGSDRREIAMSLIVLARIALAQGARAAAWAPLGEGLDLCRELGDRWAIALALEVLGGLVAASQPARALRLAAAASVLRAAIGRPVPPPERSLVEGWLAPARRALGQAAAGAAWEAGASLSAGSALAAALAEDIAGALAASGDGPLGSAAGREQLGRHPPRDDLGVVA